METPEPRAEPLPPSQEPPSQGPLSLVEPLQPVGSALDEAAPDASASPGARARWVARNRFVVAAIVALVVVAGGVFAVRVLRGTPAPRSTSPVSFASVLAAQSAALLAGDERRFLAAVAPGTAAYGTYQMIYKNLRALRVSTFRQQPQPVTALGPVPPEPLYTDAVTFCLGEKVCAGAKTALYLSVAGQGATAVIDGVEFGDPAPPPWLLTPLTVAVGSRVMLAAGSQRDMLAGALPGAERSAQIADRYAVAGGAPDHYLIYLADTAESTRWYGGLSSGRAAQAYPDWLDDPGGLDDPPVVVDVPVAAGADQRIGIDGIVLFMMGVVVAEAKLPNALQESALFIGLAYYIADIGFPAVGAMEVAAVRAYVRTGNWDGSCRQDWGLRAPPDTVAGFTGIGYLMMRFLIARYGVPKALAFRADSLTYADSDVARHDLGVPWDVMDKACGEYVRLAIRG